jgi:hypothetical protein
LNTLFRILGILGNFNIYVTNIAGGNAATGGKYLKIDAVLREIVANKQTTNKQ